ncbi:MAG: DnaJ domain-containing protein [Desulfobacterales bacterium]|nr:DnaJ domain-containing protein [Desulfobacterales bacterium]
MGIHGHYKTLGLPPEASDEDAKHAYRKLVNRWHPDRFAQDVALQQLAEEHLKLFNIAYAEVKKHLASRPRRYKPRSGQTTRFSPGFRHRWSPKSRSATGSGAVLNRLTRKFRQIFAAWIVAPRRPVRARTRSAASRGFGPTPTGRETHKGTGTTSGKNFDAVFNEVAGPEAARIKKAAARKKRGRLKRNIRRNTTSGSAGTASGKARNGNSPVATPVSRIKRVPKVRRI